MPVSITYSNFFRFDALGMLGVTTLPTTAGVVIGVVDGVTDIGVVVVLPDD